MNFFFEATKLGGSGLVFASLMLNFFLLDGFAHEAAIKASIGAGVAAMACHVLPAPDLTTGKKKRGTK